MESSLDYPFAFFDYYLKKPIYTDWKNYSSGIIQNVFDTPLDEIDNEKKILKVFNASTNDFDLYSFENHLKVKFDEEVQKSKHFIELGFQKIYSNKDEIGAYAEFLKIKIQALQNLKAFKDFQFLTSIINEFTDLVNLYSKKRSTYNSFYSFNLLVEDGEVQKNKIDSLFNLLTESPPLISCTKNEFRIAFTSKRVTARIKWLYIGKNKQISKVSLFYFVEQLIDKSFLSKNIISDLNKYVYNVFSDSNGLSLRNLKQSKATLFNNQPQKNRIDSIISQL